MTKRLSKNEIILKAKYASVLLYNKAGEIVAKAKIDLSDVVRVSKLRWSLTKEGYVQNRQRGIYLHSFIMRSRKQHDHKNTNKLDNRKKNLRPCSHSQNACNRNIPANNTSGAKGIWKRPSGRFAVEIWKHGKKHVLGTFDTMLEAVDVHKKASAVLHKSFARSKHSLINMALFALLVTTFVFKSVPVGSSRLVYSEDAETISYGGDNSLKLTTVKKADVLVKLKVSILTEVLKEHTSGKDAEKTAKRYCYNTDDPELWTAMDIVETHGNSKAVSNKGAQGRLQVMPWWKNKKGFEFYRGRYSHLNDDLNFKAAHKILTDYKLSTRGNKWLAVERYCGKGADARYYVKKVKRVYYKIKVETSPAYELAALGN